MCLTDRGASCEVEECEVMKCEMRFVLGALLANGCQWVLV